MLELSNKTAARASRLPGGDQLAVGKRKRGRPAIDRSAKLLPALRYQLARQVARDSSYKQWRDFVFGRRPVAIPASSSECQPGTVLAIESGDEEPSLKCRRDEGHTKGHAKWQWDCWRMTHGLPACRENCGAKLYHDSLPYQV